ncbi:16S rRNA (guanine(966)-N(2))-methyltransferase RsmD [Bacillus horti]
MQAVPGKNTRPTTDKVKESIFNLLEQHSFTGGLALDLYAGTGGLGIEALSRGLDKVIFVDTHKKAINIINQNLDSLSISNQAEVYRNEASRALKAIIKRELSFDLIFLDPPYAEQQISTQLAVINDYNLLAEEGRVVVETGKDTDLPKQVGQLQQWKHQNYGETDIRIYVQRSKEDM